MRGVIAWIAFVAASAGAAGYTVDGSTDALEKRSWICQENG